MADCKKIRVRINLWDRQKMVRYLEKQARNGWLFCGFEDKKWQFRAIDPQNIRFSVAYFAGYKADDYEAGQRMVEFREYCAHDGWQFVGCFEEVQVFYNLNENPIPIDTDPRIEVETMHTIALRKMKPQFLRYLVLTAVLLGLAAYAYRIDPVEFLLHAPFFIMLLAYGGGFLVYLLRVIEEFLWLHQAKRYAATHAEYPYDLKHLRVSTLTGGIVALVLFEMLLRHLGFVNMLWMIGSVGVLIALILLVIRWSENLPFSKRKCDIICAISMIAVLILVPLVLSKVMMAVGVEGDLYVPLGSTWEQYEETPPLDMEAYYGDDLEDLFCTSFVEETPFLAKYSARMYADRDEDSLELSYDILEVKWDILYDFCLENYMNQYGIGSLAAMDATPWGAETAHCRGANFGQLNLWLLGYEDRIVMLYVNEEPTPEQKALVGQRLG